MSFLIIWHLTKRTYRRLKQRYNEMREKDQKKIRRVIFINWLALVWLIGGITPGIIEDANSEKGGIIILDRYDYATIFRRPLTLHAPNENRPENKPTNKLSEVMEKRYIEKRNKAIQRFEERKKAAEDRLKAENAAKSKTKK